MEKNFVTENAEAVVDTATESLKGIMSFQFILSIFLSMILTKMILWVNAL